MNAAPQASRVGEIVGSKYRLIRVLASGGMGVVYEAQHVVVKRRFAIKFLRADFADRREILTRFHREAQTAGALESENIAAAIDFGILPDGTPYIVMEYLIGESLGGLLAREGRLPVGRAADLCLQACRGMEAAHGSGIVHRDLKPENLFVCRRDDGTDLVKVLDFGIAKLEQAENSNAATRTGTILGTPAYMSPEQARGDKSIDHRTDVYGLAAILFEMLSGRKPHPGDSYNAILHHISTQPAVALHSLGIEPALPPGLVSAVERALSSNPDERHPSAEALGQALAPFARREVWTAPKDVDSGAASAPTSTPGEQLAPFAGSTVPVANAQSPPPQPRRLSRTVMWGGASLLAAAAIASVVVLGALGMKGAGRMPRPTAAKASKAARIASDRSLPRDTRFFVPAPPAGAVQQIADLVKQKAFLDAAPLTALAATPQAIWLTGGSPDEVRSAVQNTVVRATADRRVPIFVANNIPFRDCAQYSAGGATTGAAYRAWIDALASGIGNGRAVVILEPDSLGIIPHNTSIWGEADWCKPTIVDADGRTIAAPEATPKDRYDLLNHAVDSILDRAPNASVYLDGTHAGWLGVGEIASRLVKAGVQRAQGFFVNVANFHPTPQSIQYGTWISKCIHYANNTAAGAQHLGRYADCGSQYGTRNVNDAATWAETDKWYAENVDHAPNPPSGTRALTHFVIDTSRNGRGALDATRFAQGPYDQPPNVIRALKAGDWCNPPEAGVGARPTADTGDALVDAFFWVKPPGSSDGSCDIAGGARAWDYARYNPWGIGGDAQNHFDPLWGAVDPGAGAWFPDEALQLAHNANPPLHASDPQAIAPPGNERPASLLVAGQVAASKDARPTATAALRIPVRRPAGRPAGRPPELHDNAPAAPTPSAPLPARVTFDPQNPYGN